ELDRFVVGGIVDQDVEPAEAVDHAVDHRLHLVAPGDVAGERRGTDLVLLEFLPHTLGLRLALRVDDGDVATFFCKCMTDSLPEPAIAAGDDSDLSLKLHLSSHPASVDRATPVALMSPSATGVARSDESVPGSATWPVEAVMFAQGIAFVLGPEQAALLQQR